MNIDEFIESGMIESCVLGIATEAEQRELASLCEIHPKIRKARLAFELALEQQLMKEAVNPPEELKRKIFSVLKITDANGSSRKSGVVYGRVHRTDLWRWVAAASIILLVCAGYWIYRIGDQNRQLQVTNTVLKNRLVESNRNDAILELHPIVQRPSIKWSTMLEPSNPGHCMAHIYWDSLSTNIYLLLGNIPKPLSEKQFQLWALDDSRPVSLGLFDIKNEGQLVQMKHLDKARSFVITIEPRGGSTTPTLKETYAVGEL